MSYSEVGDLFTDFLEISGCSMFRCLDGLIRRYVRLRRRVDVRMACSSHIIVSLVSRVLFGNVSR